MSLLFPLASGVPMLPVASVVIVLIAVAALAVTIARGAAYAFMLVYLPATLMLWVAPPLQLQGLPDAGAPQGAMYGIIIGLLVQGGQRLGIRLNLVDLLVLLLTISASLSSFITEQVYSGISALGGHILGMLGPYFIARVAFQNPRARLEGLVALLACVAVLLIFAPIELRLWPSFYTKVLGWLGMYWRFRGLPGKRYGYFRAQLCANHPIDMGNTCIALIAILGVLASTTAMGLRHWAVRVAIVGLAFTLVASLSAGPVTGAAAMLGLYLVFTRLHWVRRTMLLPIVGGMVLAGVLFTGLLLQLDYSRTKGIPTWEDSFRVRVEIVQKGWVLARDSGPWGHGHMLTRDDVGLDSVDNAYMLFLLHRGWVFLLLWLCIPLLVAWRATKALRRCQAREQWWPLVLAICGLLGLMVSMYTVWAGMLYGTLFIVLLGFTTTMTDHLTASLSAAQPARLPPSHGPTGPVPALQR